LSIRLTPEMTSWAISCVSGSSAPHCRASIWA
jgi:hypothetical protein